MAIVTDDTLTDVPERYRDPERAARLVSIVADAVDAGGVLIAPASAWDVQERARDAGCRVAVFSAGESISPRDAKVAFAAAWVARDRIVVEHGGQAEDIGVIRDDAPAGAQVAAALCAWSIDQLPGRRRGSTLRLHDAIG